jgi:hypothetical protein
LIQRIILLAGQPFGSKLNPSSSAIVKEMILNDQEAEQGAARA